MTIEVVPIKDTDDFSPEPIYWFDAVLTKPELLHEGLVTEVEAVHLASRLKDYLHRHQALMPNFLLTNERDFNGKPIPVMSLTGETEKSRHNQWWVFIHRRDNSPIVTPKFKYFTYHQEAKTYANGQRKAGYICNIRGANGSSDQLSQRNEISRGLFHPDLMYGLYQIAHESLHSITDKLPNWDLRKAITEHLTNEVLRNFAQVDASGQKISDFIERYLNDKELSDTFWRLATFRATELKEHDPKNYMRYLHRNIIQTYSQFYSDPVKGTEKLNKRGINEAFLASKFPYTHHVVIKKIFESQNIDWHRFIADLNYCEDNLHIIIPLFDDQKNNPPKDISAEWENISQKLKLSGQTPLPINPTENEPIPPEGVSRLNF